MALVRLQIEVDEDQLKDMESLMQECGIRTKKDLINNAYTIFKWAVKKRKEGCEIAAVDSVNNRFIELDMPALSSVQKQR